MRYPASEKLEIIRIVEQSHLPAKLTLDKLGIARRTFYRWYDRFLEGGSEALEDRPSAPSRVWNRIPPDIHDQIIELALEQSELSPRELAVRFTDERRYFVSEATVYRLLKAHDLITSPTYVVIKAADQFHTKTTRVNEMWQTDFTYFKIIGWGWMYLSTVLDDFSRYIIAWKLCTNMRAEDVTDTLDMALAASGCDSATVLHKPRLLSDNGPSYIAGELAVRFTDERRYFVSEATVYRLLKAHDLITSPAYVVIKAADQFHTKTTRVNEMWQTDFTYFKIIGWGWMYLSTVLDDFSRYIIAWKLCTNMRAEDVTDTLDLALEASGCDSATVLHKPRLLSDNGPSYIAGELAEYIEARKMSHVRGAPMHPQTQGKIERWHQTLKNRILLENYFLPGDLEAQIEAFVEHYNHRRYHESLNNVTPADAYFGRADAIIKQRERIKRKTIEHRRLLHRKIAA